MLKTCNPCLFFPVAVNGSLGGRCEVLQISYHVTSVISETSLILFPICKKNQTNKQNITKQNKTKTQRIILQGIYMLVIADALQTFVLAFVTYLSD